MSQIDLKSYGSTHLYDAIFLFAFPPIGLISLAANIFSYVIFSARYFRNKPLYTYLKVICLNSSIINLVFAISFICASRRYLDLANTEFATYFRCYIKIPFINTCYFYGSLIDIVLAIDRLIEFTRFKGRFRQFNPTVICAFLFLLCVIINAPYILIFEPKKKPIANQFFYYYGESRFALSPQGIIFKNIQYFIRDILTLILLVFINLITLTLFR